MKLHLSILKNIIDLDSLTLQELRTTLDELGLEVKNISGSTINDSVFTLETLANRGDHLSALGCARELSARFLKNIKLPQAATELPEQKVSLPVSIDTDLCHACGLLELNLPPSMTIPPEVAAATQADGVKHHPIVDLLNYLQLENGQPMHAFDKDKIEGEIRICLTEKEEEVEALNGKKYKLPIGSIVHRDAKKIIDIAGIIGCANTMVTEETKRVIVEAAAFDPVAIRKTARKIALVTEASHSFERGTDRENIPYTLRRLVYMSQGANRDGSGCQPLGSYFNLIKKPEAQKIAVKIKKLKQEANLPRLATADIVVRLKHLGYAIEGDVSEKSTELLATPPSWRCWDAGSEMDVIEDYISSLGLSKVKLEVPLIEPELPVLNPYEAVREKLEPLLIGCGFSEAITKGFYSDEALKLVETLATESAGKHIRLKNSVESSFAAMKFTNILHLAELAEKNLRFGVLSPKIFEFGRVFNRESTGTAKSLLDLEYENEVLSLAVAGKWNDAEWGTEEKLQVKLLQFKGMLETLFSALGREFSIQQGGTNGSALLHPGYSAVIKSGAKKCGTFGLIHPSIKRHLNLRNDVLYAELDVLTLHDLIQSRTYTPKTDLPSIKRDFTLRIGAHENADKVIKTISHLNPENLVEISIVDDFHKSEESFRRVSYRLKFQRSDKTLQHEEINSEVEKILSALKEKGVELV